MTTDERRAKPRFDVHQFVDISFMKEEFIPVKGLNLSENGILVRAEQPLEPYTKIFFMLSLEGDQESIRGEGISIRCDSDDEGFLLGVQIIDMKYGDKLKLKSFLDKLKEG